MSADLATVRCPGCREPFQVAATALGKPVRCPLCGHVAPAEAAPVGLPVGEVAEEPLSLDDAEPLPPPVPRPALPPARPREPITRKQVFLSVALTLAAVGGVLFVYWLLSPPTDWIEFVPPEGRCRVELPSEPTEEPVSEQVHVVGGKRYSVDYREWTQPYQITFGWLDLEAEAMQYTSLEKIAERDREARGINDAELVEEGYVKINANDGREFRLQVGEESLVERVVLVRQGEQARVYVLAVRGSEITANTPFVRRYFESLRINKPS